jgi:hypothetical protein
MKESMAAIGAQCTLQPGVRYRPEYPSTFNAHVQIERKAIKEIKEGHNVTSVTVHQRLSLTLTSSEVDI